MKRIITLLICPFVIIFACHGQDDYSFKETYKVSTPARLTLSSSDGNLDIKPSQGNEIQVFYIARRMGKVLDISRDELEKELVVEVSHNSNSVQISIKNRNENFGLFNWKDQIDVSFRVLVPEETACELFTSDGNISLQGVTSDQRCKTSDGNIHLTKITGNVEGGTSDGNIDAKNIGGDLVLKTSDGNIAIEEAKGNIEAKTSDGHIRLTKVSGEINARTSDGDVTFNEVSGTLIASTSDGNVRGEIVALQKELNINTGDGNIDLTIPARMGLDLDIKGESIQVPLENFSGKSDEHYISGKSNGGGVAVRLSTSDGHVRVAYR